MNVKITPLFILLLFSICVQAQFNDDFSSGSLSQWSGDTSDFIINSEDELQLMAPTSGASFIFVDCQVPDSTVWELNIRLDFAPSGSNQFTWLLQSDTHLPSDWSGYGIRLGESGDNDALELIRYDEGTSNILARIAEGDAGNDPVELMIRVERRGGTFTLLASYTGNSVYTDTVLVEDNTYGPGPSLFTVIQCNYTSTRTDKFFFDDFENLNGHMTMSLDWLIFNRKLKRKCFLMILKICMAT